MAYTKFNSFVEALAEKVHNLGTDTIKVMLTNSAPSASNTVKADITEISAGSGYTAGGPQLTQISSTQTSGTYRLKLNTALITASGGSIGPFRYAVIYNDTATNKELIAYDDYGASLTLASGESVLINIDSTNGLLTIT